MAQNGAKPSPTVNPLKSHNFYCFFYWKWFIYSAEGSIHPYKSFPEVFLTSHSVKWRKMAQNEHPQILHENRTIFTVFFIENGSYTQQKVAYTHINLSQRFF